MCCYVAYIGVDVASDIESFGDVPFLEVEDFLFGLVKVFPGDFHAPLAECDESGFGAHGLDVCAGKVVLGGDELGAFDVL